MQPAGDIADDPGGLVVLTVLGEADQGSRAGRALEQDRAVITGQHPGGAIRGPPAHEQVAMPFIGVAGDLQHRRLPVEQDRKKLAGARDDEVSGGDQAPLAQVRLEHGRDIARRKGRGDRTVRALGIVAGGRPRWLVRESGHGPYGARTFTSLTRLAALAKRWSKLTKAVHPAAFTK